MTQDVRPLNCCVTACVALGVRSLESPGMSNTYVDIIYTTTDNKQPRDYKAVSKNEIDQLRNSTSFARQEKLAYS